MFTENETRDRVGDGSSRGRTAKAESSPDGSRRAEASTPPARPSESLRGEACVVRPFALIGGDAYRVLAPLGCGGMGVVVRGRDRVLERDVAIKLLRPELLAQQGAREVFIGEAKSIAQARHPNVVEIHAFGVHEGTPYYVMEYVPGPTLDAWRRRQGSVPPIGAAIDLLNQICHGVTAIHDSGAVHCDLKPSNVLVGDGPRAVIVDLGVSWVDARGGSSGERTPAGSPYLAPELSFGQANESDSGVGADVYSLGVIAYELLTGHRPITKTRAADASVAGPREEVRPPSALRPELTRVFDAPILRALATRPGERHRTVEELRVALRRAHDFMPARRRPPRLIVTDGAARGAGGASAVTDSRGEVERAGRSGRLAAIADAFPAAAVEWVADGVAAVAALERPPASPASILVVDVDLLGATPGELARTIRSRGGSGQVPIVVLATREPTGPPNAAPLGHEDPPFGVSSLSCLGEVIRKLVDR